MNANRTSWTTYLKSAFEVGKWKLELRGLRKERRSHEQEKAEAVAVLGAHAWEHGVRDEAFAPVCAELADLEGHQDALRAEAQGLDAARAEKQAERKRLEEHHGGFVAEAEAHLRAASEQQQAATSLRKDWEKAHKKLRTQEKSVRGARESARARLQKAAATPETAAEAEGLRQEIAAAESTLAEIAARIRETEEGLQQRNAEEAQRREETERREQALAVRREELARALQPVDESLRQLHEQSVAAGQRQAELAALKADAQARLGVQVNAARPPVEVLSEGYLRIDGHDADLARTDLRINTLEHDVAASGPGAKRVASAALAAVVLVLAGAAWLTIDFPGFRLGGPTVGEVAVRVADGTGESVVGASTVLFFEGGPVAQYTDIHGAATLTLDESRGRRGRLVVEADGYRIHEQEVRLSPGLFEIRMEPPDPEMASVVVRALDSSSQEPVAGADVLVHSNGDTFSQVADSHGITKFTLAFHDAKAEAQMSVESKGYEIEHQRVTLLPDRVQDVSLDRAAAQLEVAAFDIEEALVRNFRDVEDSQLLPGTRGTGALRAGTVAKYAFPGHPNTPILFTVKRTDGDLSYKVLIYDKKDFLVKEFGRFGQGTQSLAFTPRADGEHELHLQGTHYGGAYAVTMSYLSGPPEARNLLGSLTGERSEKGMLGAGSYDDFEFQGEANKPLLLKVQRSSGDLGYHVALYDAKQTLLEEHGRFGGGTHRIPFTPRADATYRVRLWGEYYFGSYTLALGRLGSGEDALAALVLGESRQGKLAVGAYHDYGFPGSHNTPLLFTVQRSSGDLSYGIEIYDAQNRRIAEHGRFGGGTAKVAFNPRGDGEYRLRIYGTHYFGSYGLSLDLLSGPPEERNKVRPLTAGGSHTGSLGDGAYDEYSVEGRAGEPLTLTLQRRSGNLGYWVRILDAEGNELDNQGRFGSGLRRIPFEPPADGTFRVQVTANESFGSYVISLNEG